jgi:putative ABC transport system permease protein
MREGRIRFALLTSGLRWRAGTTTAMLVVAVVGVGIGAFGPLYLHGADQSILNSTLAGAPPGVLGLTMEPAQTPGSSAQLSSANARVPRPNAGSQWFGRPIITDDAGVTTTSQQQAFAADLVARSGVCAHLHIVSGACTESDGAVVMSTRSASELGVSTGQAIHLAFTRSTRTANLTIAGLYRATAPTDPYWWGVNYFGFGTHIPPAPPSLDAMFTTDRTVVRVAPRPLVSHLFQVPFTSGSLSVDDVPAFEGMLSEYERSARDREDVVVSSELPDYLTRSGTTQHTTTLIIAVVDLELVLLVACVLYFVASRTAAEREPDVRLAVLRGYPPRSVLGVAMAEPIAVVVAAVPMGLLLAWMVFIASAHALFGADVGSMTLLSIGAALASGVAAAGAVVLGNRRAMTGSEIELSQRPSQRARVLGVVLSTAVVAIAIAAFVELALAGVATGSTGSTSDPLSALAPALLALALGVLGTRLLPAALRARQRSTPMSAGVPWTLASRRVARQTEFAPQIVVLALSAGLAVFAISGWVISARNRDVQGEFAVGASKVLTVSVHPGTNFLSAVRAADASGDSAMAAVLENTTDGTTLAVDASRMNGVMSWPNGLGAGGAKAVARNLVPRGLSPRVLVSGDAVRVTVVTKQSAQPAPQLAIDFFDNSYQTPQQVELGSLVPGPWTYQASIAGLCPSSCRLVDLGITWSPPPTAESESPPLDVEFTSLSEHAGGKWVQISTDLGKVVRWTSPAGGARLSSSSGGLEATATLNTYGTPIEIAPFDVPSKLPAVVTPTVAEFSSGLGTSLSIVGLDGATLSAEQVGEIPALPRVGSAALVDLGVAERMLTGPFANETTQVWLSRDAPADIEARLAKEGMTVVSTDSVQARENTSEHGGVELAYTLFLISAVAAGALAVGTTGFAIVVSTRRRETEFAAMTAVGISTRSLRRSVQTEQAVVVGAGLLLGIVAGVVSAAVALKTLPEFVALGPGPPLQMNLPVPDLLAAAGALIAALGLTVVLASSLVTYRSSVTRVGGGGP